MTAFAQRNSIAIGNQMFTRIVSFLLLILSSNLYSPLTLAVHVFFFLMLFRFTIAEVQINSTGKNKPS